VPVNIIAPFACSILGEMKQPDFYFSTPRLEVLTLLPTITSCLEVGCGNGATLRAVREHNPGAWLAGIEYESEMARQIEADQVLVGDVESLDLSVLRSPFDAILCLDVLEHLRDPWGLTRHLAELLRPGGVMIASIPNVAHYSIIVGLLQGRWTYAPYGILDRTHLRFFTRDTAIDLLRQAGLTPVAADTNCATAAGLFNAVTGRLFENLCAIQYLVKAVKGPCTWEPRPYWAAVRAQARNFGGKLVQALSKRA
jgi:SAM-dependent methyltransferase